MNNTTVIDTKEKQLVLSDFFEPDEEKIINQILDRKRIAKNEGEQVQLNTVLNRYLNHPPIYQKLVKNGLSTKYLYNLILTSYENQTR